jgi:8-oxo-dGTP pyrophosphatase MutT (NUDIX family)
MYVEMLQKFAERSKRHLPEYWAGFVFYCPEDDTILLEKRSGIMNNPHLWDVPGGTSDKGDHSILETAKREVTEELAAFPENYKIIDSFAHEVDGKDQYIWVALVSLQDKENWRAKMRIDEESSDISWFKTDELPKKKHMRMDISWLMERLPRMSRSVSASRNSQIIKQASVIQPRYEYKYLLPKDMAEVVKYLINPSVIPDDYGKDYKIQNVYMDNDDLDLYSGHLDPKRHKLRIRKYNTGDDNVFFETKHKKDGHTSKQRTMVPRSDYTRALGDRKIPWINSAVEIGARPMMSIGYDREAYNGTNGGRVTFDTNIKCAPIDKSDIRDSYGILPEDIELMELKFNGNMPDFMKLLIKHLDLNRVPFSKYFDGLSKFLFDI